MNIQQVVQNSSLIQGGIGGIVGAFLIIAADCFVHVGLNLKGWGRKILYIFAGAVVGMLFNYHTRAGILYTSIIGGGWTVFVTSFRTVAKTFVESIVKHSTTGFDNEDKTP